jgi:uncharacterized protein (DUF2147 family)
MTMFGKYRKRAARTLTSQFGVSLMRARLLTFVALLSLIAGVERLSADPTPVGLWQAVDDETKQPTGWFLISEQAGVYTGIIAKMFLKPGEDPNVLCDQCKDDRRNHPWLGIELIRGMQQESADKYGGGTILDPRDGKTYHATMKIAPDGQTLVVRGYLGVELLGRNQYWTRLPDSAYSMLDPSINPNPAVNPAPAAPVAPAAPARKPAVAPKP